VVFPTAEAALLGLLLKKNTVVETGPIGPLVGQDSAASVVGGWAGSSTAGSNGFVNKTRVPNPSAFMVALCESSVLPTIATLEAEL
jgi:hypothetical protein